MLIRCTFAVELNYSIGPHMPELKSGKSFCALFSPFDNKTLFDEANKL